MDLLFLSVVALVALALLFDFSNGFHDAANSIATVVATRVMSARTAVWFSAVCNFAAYFFVGTGVANTVAKTVDSQDEGIAVVFGALVAAVTWNYVTWYRGMPSSSSHAVIGGLIGAGLVAGGLDAINWNNVGKTVAAIVVSPLVAFAVAALATVLVRGLQMATRWDDDAKPFKGMQLVSAAAVSFGHGANDAQKTMGVIAALLAAAGYLRVDESTHALPVPWWVAISAYAAIALGTVWGGWRIIQTMGLRLCSLNARTGASANIGATTAIFGATALGIPISTTHAAASSVVGAGTAARRGTNWKVVGEMSVAWVCTIPATAAIGAVLYSLSQLPTVLAWVTLFPIILGLGGLMIWAMAHGVKADDLEAEIRARAEAPATPEPLTMKSDLLLGAVTVPALNGASLVAEVPAAANGTVRERTTAVVDAPVEVAEALMAQALEALDSESETSPPSPVL